MMLCFYEPSLIKRMIVFGRQLNLGKDGLQLMIRSPELSIKKPGTEKYPTALRVLQAKCPTSLQQVWDQIKSCSENCHMAKLKVTFHNLDRSIMREELSEAILNTANPYTVTLSKPMLHKSPVCRGAEVCRSFGLVITVFTAFIRSLTENLL